MVSLQQDILVSSTVIEHWWRQSRHEHRLFLRLMSEKPEDLARLPYLAIISKHIKRNRSKLLEMVCPKITQGIRRHLLAAEQYFLECLDALSNNKWSEAEEFYNMAHADLSMLQFIFMTNGIKSYI